MKILSLSLTKFSCEKFKQLSNPSINNHIEFIDIEKETIELLSSQSLKLSFRYLLTYSLEKDPKKVKEEDKQAEVICEGFVILSVNKDESKEFEKSWKKKQIPEPHIIPLYNFILRRCSIKAVPLQDELGLPSPYFSFPSITKKED